MLCLPGKVLSHCRNTQKSKQEVIVRGCDSTKDPFVGERESSRGDVLEKADYDENCRLMDIEHW